MPELPWGAVAAGLVALATVVGTVLGGVAFVRNDIHAAEGRLSKRIDNVEASIGNVEVSIDTMRVDLQDYERNHNERQIVVENRLTTLETKVDAATVDLPAQRRG